MNNLIFLKRLANHPIPPRSRLTLTDGARVAVMGGGPAGASFAYFLLDLAERAGLKIQVDIYEPRDFGSCGPKGCNYCAGVISESLIRNMASEGINLNPTVIQRAINSYVWHTDHGDLRVEFSPQEYRIATVFRGGGPRQAEKTNGKSFDELLLSMAEAKGARVVRKRVISTARVEGGVRVKPQSQDSQIYDLLAVATGVNTPTQNLFRQIDEQYRPPSTTKTAIREYYLGAETIYKYMGSSLHVFLMNIPRLKFGMVIPKGDYVTVCLLGQQVDEGLIRDFMTAPELRACFPADWDWEQTACQCMPRIPYQGAVQPYADRVVFIGDVSVSRLYKDGIGSAFRAAKAAAATAILNGISEKDFERHYAPFCRHTARDNLFGRLIFFVTYLIQHIPPFRKTVLCMAAREQAGRSDPRMGSVLWDTFTGSAAYEDIFWRALRPSFLWDLLMAFLHSNMIHGCVLPQGHYAQGD